MIKLDHSLADSYEGPVGGRKQPQPGDVLDGTYRIDQVLGTGGVGVVCAAWHVHVGRPCAVKFLHPHLVSNPELRQRFRREAQSAFQLGHPHIVSITDFRENPGGWPYIVMELVTGDTLRARLEQGALPPALAVRLMMELCDALHTAHRRGVIHRDLKPENLFLVDTEEGGVFLKVLDFGLSKILDDVEITETGRLLGSPSYMAPEQARGDSHLSDARSDIFAVGSLLYECLTGDKLFEAPSFEKKRQRIVNADLGALTSELTKRDLPPLLEVILRTACSKEPEDRYQSAAAMLEALSEAYEILGGEEARPRTSGTFATVHRPSQPPPAPRAPTPITGEMVSGRLRKATPAPVSAAVVSASSAISSSSGRSASSAPSGSSGARPAVVAGLAVPVAAASPVPAASPAPAASPVPAPELTPASPPASLPYRPSHSLRWAVVVVGGIVVGGAAVLLGARMWQRPPGSGAPSELRPVEAPVEPALGKGGGSAPGVRSAPPPRPSGAKPSVAQREPRPRDLVPPRETPGEGASARAPEDAQEPLSFREVEEVMVQSRRSLVRCFAPEVPLPRRVVVDAEVQSSGQVSEASTTHTGEEASCVVDVIRSARFPSFRSNETVSIHYEFVNLRRE